MKIGWLFAVLSITVPALQGYSVLSHEAIVDSLWLDSITPLIKKRFPDVTAEQLATAHSYTYGGAIIQDMGYFPFGSKLFSDLTHYVRSGAFVAALIRDSQTVDEYAFALGALAHYSSDTVGHPTAINRVVPRLYPKLRAKYGAVVAYEQDPVAHLKTEFGFDVLEIAKGRYASNEYHDFIGFRVAKPILERAFLDTYSVELKDLFQSLDLALGTYRQTVSGLLPAMTRAAWHERRKEIQQTKPGITKQKFIYNLSRSSYEKEWGTEYKKPGVRSRLIAFLFRILPKIGPLRAFAFHVPDADSEKLFMASFNDTIARYKQLLQTEASGTGTLADRNLDTGGAVKLGSYGLEDRAYEHLLEKLGDGKREVNEALRASILEYYGRGGKAVSEKAQKALAALQR